MDDLEPIKKPEILFRRLDALSVNGLRDYIAELEEEIRRAQEEIKRRGSARDIAEAFFTRK